MLPDTFSPKLTGSRAVSATCHRSCVISGGLLGREKCVPPIPLNLLGQFSQGPEDPCPRRSARSVPARDAAKGIFRSSSVNCDFHCCQSNLWIELLWEIALPGTPPAEREIEPVDVLSAMLVGNRTVLARAIQDPETLRFVQEGIDFCCLPCKRAPRQKSSLRHHCGPYESGIARGAIRAYHP